MAICNDMIYLPDYRRVRLGCVRLEADQMPVRVAQRFALRAKSGAAQDDRVDHRSSGVVSDGVGRPSCGAK